MSIIHVDVYHFDDITMALQNAQIGDELNFYIYNDIVFTNVVMITKQLSIHLLSGNSDNPVTLAIANGGSYRHFSTGTSGTISNLSMSIGEGITLDGATTGGGVYIYGSNCDVTIEDCTFINCLNNLNGGAIFVGGNASRNSLTMNNVHIKQCQAVSGGGLFAYGSYVMIRGGEITGNRANNSGGGIATTSGASRLGTELTIIDANISRNATVLAFGDGGAINAFDTIVEIQGSQINDNTSDNHGGGIYVMPQILGKAYTALTIRDSTVKGNTARNFGGGISVTGEINDFRIINSLITENESTSTAVTGSNQGGGIYATGGSTLRMSDGFVSKNRAARSGGGIFIDASTLILSGSAQVSENISDIIGGGLYGYSLSTIIIEGDAKVIHNSARSSEDPERLYGGGGGVTLYASELIVRENALISGNTSVSYGGGIWTYPDFTPISSVLIQGGTIGNNAANYGGGISMGAVAGYTPLLMITGGAITGNTAVKDGGGIITKGCEVSVADCEMTDNTAGRDGGAIFTDDLSLVTVYASTSFSGNSAQSYAFWTLTSGGDSDIHMEHIFTDRFSTFIPVQSAPFLIWSFSNAYNNYDINYVMPLKIITVYFVDVQNPSSIIHTTSIDSFVGATLTIEPFFTFVDSDNLVWTLSPADQPAQTIDVTDPQADYAVTFYYASPAMNIVVTEYYVDINGHQIAGPTQTIVEQGGMYRKAAPDIENYDFVGYRIDHGPLQNEPTVHIIGIDANTDVTFVYRRKGTSPCYRCKQKPCRCSLPLCCYSLNEC